MPSVSTENFSSYHTIPLPVNKTKWVITKPYVNFNEKNIQYINTPCPKIEEVENTALLHFGNCNIEINGITYEGSPDVFWDEIRISPLTPSEIHTNPTIEVLNSLKLNDCSFKKQKLQEFRIETTVRHHCTTAATGTLFHHNDIRSHLHNRRDVRNNDHPHYRYSLQPNDFIMAVALL